MRYRQVKLALSLILIVCLPYISGCVSQDTQTQPEFTPSPTATYSPSPTVVWFPPTPTYTPVPSPTLTPTPEQSTSPLGIILFKDTFTSPEVWQTGQFTNGTISLANNELTIAVNQSQGYLATFRTEPILKDFHATITARAILCNEGDEYGLLLRANPAGNFYRYAVSCSGEIRLDRIFNGSATSPQPWMPSALAPRGAPSIIQLGVTASGEEMHFFINGEHQFSINDPAISEGVIGLFARAKSDSPLTVHFANLEVYTLNPSPLPNGEP